MVETDTLLKDIKNTAHHFVMLFSSLAHKIRYILVNKIRLLEINQIVAIMSDVVSLPGQITIA
jgi:hypothetical protein